MHTLRYGLVLASLCVPCLSEAQTLPGGGPGYSIVYDWTSGSGDFDVFNVQLDGSNVVNVTNAAGDQFWPTCSPDGTRIAFYLNGPQSDIYTVQRDGTGLFNVTNTGAFGQNERDPDWSPTGKFIAYVSNIGGGGIDVIQPDGSGWTRVFSNTGSLTAADPSVSPNGKSIAFAGSTPGVGTAIYTIRTNGTGLTQVTFPGAGYFDAHPDWSPDGKAIVFVRLTGAIFDLWVTKSNGTGAFALTTTADFEAFPAWSPDGKLITYSRRPGYSDPWKVYTMRADGTQQTSLGVFGEHPDFCSDRRTKL